MKSLSDIARGLNANLNALRAFLYRHRPDLIERGQFVSQVRAFDEEAVAEIRQAYTERRKRGALVVT